MAKVTVKGGDKLYTKLAELQKAMGGSPYVEVGFLEGATYPDLANTPVAMVMCIQEYGAPAVGIPPRPFFRSMISAKQKQWPKMAAKLLAGTGNAHATLDQMGTEIASELRDSIMDTSNFAPLSPVTVMLRDMKSQDQTLGSASNPMTYTKVMEARAKVEAGESNHGASTKPLIDTGHALDSIDFKVID